MNKSEFWPIKSENAALWGSVFGGVLVSLGLVAGAAQAELVMRDGEGILSIAVLALLSIMVGGWLIYKVRAYRAWQLQQQFAVERLLNDQHAILSVAMNHRMAAMAIEELADHCALPVSRVNAAVEALIEEGVCGRKDDKIEFLVVKLAGGIRH